MIITETPLAGAYLIELEKRHDERGFFARTFCRDALKQSGIDMDVAQCNISSNRRRGTLRGMHFQAPPRAEQKLVRCIRGAVHDVIVDLRPESATYRHWFATELTAEQHNMLFVPRGFAHGFQTLADDTELFYLMGENYSPAHARGFRYDDPAIGISWPLPVSCLSERDGEYAAFLDQNIHTEPAKNYPAAATFCGANR